MGIQNYYLFLVTAFIFIITPGIDTMFVLNRSLGQGRKAGIYSSLGISSGILVHTLFAALGLSLIVAKSAMAFAIVKYCGAAYLVYLGISSLIRNKKLDLGQHTAMEEQSHFKNYYTGLLTNTLNPKVALFFLSFFPQFIERSSLKAPKPFILLGISYCVVGVIWFLLLTCLAAAFSGKLKGNPKFAERLNKVSAAVYVLMGIKIALSKR